MIKLVVVRYINFFKFFNPFFITNYHNISSNISPWGTYGTFWCSVNCRVLFIARQLIRNAFLIHISTNSGKLVYWQIMKCICLISSSYHGISMILHYRLHYNVVKKFFTFAKMTNLCSLPNALCLLNK